MNADADIKLNVAEIQRFCMHDGPGVRTTVFLKGCPMRCLWCHNSEMREADKQLLYSDKKCICCQACAVCKQGVHTFDGFEHKIDREKCIKCGECETVCPTGATQICGREMTVGEIIAEIKKDEAFYGTQGGVTLSGGEPFLQENAVKLLQACKAQGINTAVETCGYYDVTSAVPYVDLFLWDIKDTDGERHKKYTGASNKRIIENLFKADGAGAKIRLRCILVNGVNADETHYKNVSDIKSKLKNCTGADVLPYHAFGGVKAKLAGLPDTSDKAMIPDEKQVMVFKSYLK